MENSSYPPIPEINPSQPLIETDFGEESQARVIPGFSSPVVTRKRDSASIAETPPHVGNPEASRKTRKVSRACDFCKSRKAKCSGDRPCAKCRAKGLVCMYDSKYTRGRPPTPPASEIQSMHHASTFVPLQSSDVLRFQPLSGTRRKTTEVADMSEQTRALPLMEESNGPSRASPELSMAEIQGQVFDPTSGLTFLHRALNRLSRQARNSHPDTGRATSEDQSVVIAADVAMPQCRENGTFDLPSPSEARLLISMFFDVCVATYRVLHRPTTETWLSTMEKNVQDGVPIWRTVGVARAAIVFVVLAFASLHREKSEGIMSSETGDQMYPSSEQLFSMSVRLADEEASNPSLESAQARTVQVLYLLTTSRFNRAWYTFGSVLQLVSALGLHRRHPKRGSLQVDYIRTQCGIRTFWTAYILDNYLGVVFGRPRHYHDEDIDQDYPDKVDDEFMKPDGPDNDLEGQEACAIDALIFHTKIAQIIGSISREVYTPRDISKTERCAAATRLMRRVQEWHSSLPAHLGSIKPSMLMPSFRRQATVLKLAHSHSIMHANRLFLLENTSSTYENQVNECIDAARSVLYTVDRLAQDGTIFHAFWWTHYVTFCALMVTYVWEAQQRRAADPEPTVWDKRTSKLMDLAERCQMHLACATATNSPSRRYAVILEKFRMTALLTGADLAISPNSAELSRPDKGSDSIPLNGNAGLTGCTDKDNTNPYNDVHPFDEWNTMDWLALDSSAFWPYFTSDVDETLPSFS